MKNLILIFLGIILISFAYQKRNELLDLFDVRFQEKSEQYTPIPPSYDLGAINDILETAILEQPIGVTFDTVMPVVKTYHAGIADLLGYHKPIARINTEARLYYTYTFLIKVGYKIEDNDILKINVYQVDDTIFVTLPPPEILTVELKRTADKLEGLRTNDKLIVNQKYITETQRNNIFLIVKQLAIERLIKNNVLQSADKIGRNKIHDFLQAVNKEYVIKVKTYNDIIIKN